MEDTCHKSKILRIAFASLLGVFLLNACETVEGNLGVAVAATSYLGTRPGNEIEQIYYLGIFDRLEQMPPQVYRVRIHGQASTISGVKFGSGWVPAELIDSLSSDLSYSRTKESGYGALEVAGGSKEHQAVLELGRRQVLFGPEGFLEAPRDHRLVVVMGTNADRFFSSIDQSMSLLAGADIQIQQEALRRIIVDDMLRLSRERLALARLPDQTPVSSDGRQ